jgi:hypothetical protein
MNRSGAFNAPAGFPQPQAPPQLQQQQQQQQGVARSNPPGMMPPANASAMLQQNIGARQQAPMAAAVAAAGQAANAPRGLAPAPVAANALRPAAGAGAGAQPMQQPTAQQQQQQQQQAALSSRPPNLAAPTPVRPLGAPALAPSAAAAATAVDASKAKPIEYHDDFPALGAAPSPSPSGPSGADLSNGVFFYFRFSFWFFHRRMPKSTFVFPLLVVLHFRLIEFPILFLRFSVRSFGIGAPVGRAHKLVCEQYGRVRLVGAAVDLDVFAADHADGQR